MAAPQVLAVVVSLEVVDGFDICAQSSRLMLVVSRDIDEIAELDSGSTTACWCSSRSSECLARTTFSFVLALPADSLLNSLRNSTSHDPESPPKPPNSSRSTIINSCGIPLRTEPKRANQSASVWAAWKGEALIDKDRSFLRFELNWSICKAKCFSLSIDVRDSRVTPGRELSAQMTVVVEYRIESTISVTKSFVTCFTVGLPLDKHQGGAFGRSPVLKTLLNTWNVQVYRRVQTSMLAHWPAVVEAGTWSHEVCLCNERQYLTI